MLINFSIFFLFTGLFSKKGVYTWVYTYTPSCNTTQVCSGQLLIGRDTVFKSPFLRTKNIDGCRSGACIPVCIFNTVFPIFNLFFCIYIIQRNTSSKRETSLLVSEHLRKQGRSTITQPPIFISHTVNHNVL